MSAIQRKRIWRGDRVTGWLHYMESCVRIELKTVTHKCTNFSGFTFT